MERKWLKCTKGKIAVVIFVIGLLTLVSFLIISNSNSNNIKYQNLYKDTIETNENNSLNQSESPNLEEKNVSTKNIIDEIEKEWKFEKVKVDELDGEIEYLGNNTFRIVPNSVNNSKTNSLEYKWKARVLYDELNETETERILKENQEKEDLSKEIIFTIPEGVKKFTFYFGETSTQIDASTDDSATAYASNKNICIDSNGKMHVAYEGEFNDLWYANSTDGASWSARELLAGSVENIGVICSPNDDIIIYYMDSSDLDMFNSTDSGVSFSGPITVEDDASVFDGSMGGAVDSNNVIHWCLVDSVDDLYYVNSSSIDNGFEISADDSDHCDIEVDSNDNAYIVVSGVSADLLEIMTSSDSWAARTLVNDTLGSVDAALYAGVSISIDDSDNILLAGIYTSDLQFCNGTTSLSSWSCQELDGDASYNPDISFTENGDIFIFYQGSVTDGYIYYANSTDGVNFNIRTEIQSSSIYASIAHSSNPSSNRIEDTLSYVFTDSESVYYDSLSVAFTPGPDTCTYVSGNWNIDCSDDCSITENLNLTENNITFTGAGNFSLRSNITNFSDIFISEGCTMNIYPEGGIN